MPNGRPPKYESAEVLIAKAQEYFVLCGKSRDLPEKAGLCLALGISRETYSQYKKDRFPDAIKAFELYIESSWVRRLGAQAATGAIFYLKNAFKEDYRDRTETDLTSKGEKITGINYIRPNGDNAPAHE
jgi:hypothetical protein